MGLRMAELTRTRTTMVGIKQAPPRLFTSIGGGINGGDVVPLQTTTVHCGGDVDHPHHVSPFGVNNNLITVLNNNHIILSPGQLTNTVTHSIAASLTTSPSTGVTITTASAINAPAVPTGLQSLLAQTQIEGSWPVEHPLPLPAWHPVARPVLRLASASFGELVDSMEGKVQELLEAHNYNTVGNFLDLYEEYRENGCASLPEFFQSYSPSITSDHHTCVGLALELWDSLDPLHLSLSSSPGLATNPTTPLRDYLYLVSCEESIGTYSEYPALYKPLAETAAVVEKEHVLLAVAFELVAAGEEGKKGGRRGVLLCDPGYHVGRVVTVMEDGCYPHTGWFVQSREPNQLKEYCYRYSATHAHFVEWYERNTRIANNNTSSAVCNNNGQAIATEATTTTSSITEVNSLIHVGRPYLTAVDVTERRNLVYNFRSWLARDGKGHLRAGIYFKVRGASAGGSGDDLTVFYTDKDKVKQRVKFNFEMFKHLDRLNDGVLNIITKCNEQMNLEPNELLETLSDLSELMSDRRYLDQLLDINNCINQMTEV